MSLRARSERRIKPSYVWMRHAQDQHAHALAWRDVVTAWQSSWSYCQAVCGHRVDDGALPMRRRRHCPTCRERVREEMTA